MKKYALVAVLVLTALAATAAACDSCGEGAVVSTPVAGGVCSTSTSGGLPAYAVPTPGPGQQVVWIDEPYKTYEQQSETVHEVRTRQVAKKYDVVKTKVVTDTKIVKVKSRSGKQPRLARGRTLRQKEYLAKETFMEDEEYLHPVKETYLVEVEKMRKIPALLDTDVCNSNPCNDGCN